MSAGGPAGVEIRLRLQQLEPLKGTAATEEGVDLAFEGWMELIGAIAEILGHSRTGESG